MYLRIFLIYFLLAFSSCIAVQYNKVGTDPVKVIVKKGKHASKPRVFRKVKERLAFKITFPEECIYHIAGENQKDWNKALGIKERYIKPHLRTLMIAWRYAPITKDIEVIPYQHDKILFPDSPLNRRFHNIHLLRVSIGETLEGFIEVEEDFWRLIIRNETIILPKSGSGIKGYIIRHYFGGDSEAPNDVILEFY